MYENCVILGTNKGFMYSIVHMCKKEEKNL